MEDKGIMTLFDDLDKLFRNQMGILVEKVEVVPGGIVVWGINEALLTDIQGLWVSEDLLGYLIYKEKGYIYEENKYEKR